MFDIIRKPKPKPVALVRQATRAELDIYELNKLKRQNANNNKVKQ